LATHESLAECVFNDAAAREDPGHTQMPDEITSLLEMRKLEAHLAAIVESSEDAIISKDLTGKIQSWNTGAEQLFGYTADEVIGKPITIIIPPDRLHEELDILSRLQRGERVEHFETIRRHKDGSLLNISLMISPVRDAQGRVVAASKVARNITERMRQEKALQEANEALTRSNEDLEQFAYSASHDLQEPLRIASAFSELLQDKFGGKLGGEGDEFIRYIVDASARMQQLLRDLRTFSQASKLTQDQVPNVDAGEVLRRTISNMKTAIDDSNAVITHGELPVVAMHEFQLVQLFQNIISNAIRYRSQTSPVIHIDAQCSDNKCTFSIRDNGIGIDPQYKEQIFGIFKRLHTTADYPGTGMGLAICQRIVERLGGRIWVESEPGRGSTFYFTLPMAKQPK
jgi:PAS domain S-box-containing protein